MVKKQTAMAGETIFWAIKITLFKEIDQVHFSPLLDNSGMGTFLSRHTMPCPDTPMCVMCF
jgi:hypothetical protein